MANLSQQKRERMLEFLNTLKEQHRDDDNTLIAINEIENEINGKKYGLVWEEHEEAVDVKAKSHIPVFNEINDKEITKSPNDYYNFLLEGDNLHSLRLLERTHKGKIDVIYIDPPYNTESDGFIYDDCTVDKNDLFRHSKWASQISKRLQVAQKLLSQNWVVYISIDDNEFAPLRMICDEILGETNFIGNIAWESKTKSQNTKTAYRKLQPKVEHILCYGSDGTKHKFNLYSNGKKEYDLIDEKGKYREHELEVMNARGVRGRSTMIFDIEVNGDSVTLPPGKQWQIGYDQVEEYKKTGDLFIRNNKVVIKMRPEYERTEKTIPYWAFFDKNIGTAESAKKDLNKILQFEHHFDTVKPVELIKELIFHAASNNSIILDFYAGSGTTAQAVIELNKEDDSHRRFILCTNNENHICENITYQRVKTVITGVRPDGSKYSDGLPANIKYYKADYIPKNHDSLIDHLNKHVKEMIQLEHGVKIDGKNYILLMDDDDADALSENWDDYSDVQALYVSRDVLFTAEQSRLFKNIETHTIPDYYFNSELREVGETW